MNRVRSVAALAAIVILAACGPASSNSGEPSSEASVAASEAASQPLASTTTDTGNGDLAGILPDEIDGIPLTYQFQSGSDVLNGEGVTPEVQAALNRLGADIDDVSTAFGFGIDQADPANPRSVSIFAMRVAGADSDQLLEEFRTSMGADNALTETNVGGKTVLTLGSDAGTAEGYMYVTGDTVFMVAASPLELSAEILSALP